VAAEQGSDPDRMLALLWRHHRPVAERPAGPGRPPRLSLDDVVRAGIGLADADDLAGVTMARVAKALDVGTMTLYSYVRSKAELVELMVDEVLVEQALPGPGEPRPGPWREQVALYAERVLDAYRRHPWLRHALTTRPPAGPGTLAEREYVLSTLTDLGLAPDRAPLAATSIMTLIGAAARLEAEESELQRTSGQSVDAWWTDRGALWEQYFDVERHPAMTAIWTAGGYHRTPVGEAAAVRVYGLDRLLDGIAAAAG
jgi:AcrR family transcriptional regulator